jgi:hypothetical protein
MARSGTRAHVTHKGSFWECFRIRHFVHMSNNGVGYFFRRRDIIEELSCFEQYEKTGFLLVSFAILLTKV